MSKSGSIIITDQSALHALLHKDFRTLNSTRSALNPLRNCAQTLAELTNFNLDNPLYGDKPITLLVPDREWRRTSKLITCRFNGCLLPEKSFFELREGLFMATPELVFLRMAAFVTEMQLAEIGENLCGRYFINILTGEIKDRTAYLTSPRALSAFVNASEPKQRGRHAALSALRWIRGNSGSPLETKTALQFCTPLSRGGFNLPFDLMNYDVAAGRLAHLTEQSSFTIDLVNTTRRVCLEYDGEESHQDAAHDKRRRNELKALGWNIFPIDKQVLYNPERTAKTGELISRAMGIRLRRSPNWEKKFVQLRTELGLPV